MYSDDEPELIDGDVFKTIVPIDLSDSEMPEISKLSDNREISDDVSDNLSNNEGIPDDVSDNLSDNEGIPEEMSDKISGKLSDNEEMSDKLYREAILAYLAENDEISAAEAAKLIERSPKTAGRVLLQLISEGVVMATGANRNRKYKTVK